MKDPKERYGMWVKCADCGHFWIAVYLPMDLELAAKIMMGAKCPMCGSGNVFIAEQRAGKLLEGPEEGTP